MNTIGNIEKIEEVNSNIINLQIKLIQENQKYNFTVCSLGYISLLAILCYTNKYIEPRVLFIILLLFGISVGLFTIFEIIKTFKTNAVAEKQAQNYKKYLEDMKKKELIEKNNTA